MTDVNKNNGFAILELALVVVVVALMVFVGGLVYLKHSAESQCGVNSQAYKTEQSKLQTFNAITIVPGQPNEPASISDTMPGKCNIDVAQTYSAAKYFIVDMNGNDALNAVTSSLSNQGFSLTKELYNQDGCSKVSGYLSYSGKGMTINVNFFEVPPDKDDCKSTQHPTIINKTDFITHKVTSIDASVTSTNNG